MLEQFLFSVGYVIIVGVVSGIYYRIGYHKGVQETIMSIRQFEPVALDKALDKMRKEIDEVLDKQ